MIGAENHQVGQIKYCYMYVVLFYFLIRDTRRELHPRESCTEVHRPEDIVYLERRESWEIARKGER